MLPNPTLTTYLDLRDGKPQGHRPNLACHLFFVNKVYWNSALAIHLFRRLLSQFKWHSWQNKWVPKLEIFPLWLLTENLLIFALCSPLSRQWNLGIPLFKISKFWCLLLCKFNPWLNPWLLLSLWIISEVSFSVGCCFPLEDNWNYGVGGF